MAIRAPEQQEIEYQKVPEGNHPAICDLIADIGIQETSYGNKHQIVYRWQFPSERMMLTKDGKEEDAGPLVVSQAYSLTMHPDSNLRKMLEGWRGKFSKEDETEFDFASMIGKPALVQIVHNGSWANVQTVAMLARGMDAPTLEGKAVVFDDDSDPDDLDDLPKWIAEKIANQIPETPF